MARFDWVPYFQGKKLTYNQYFALIGSAETLVAAFICFTTYLILRMVHMYSKKCKGLFSIITIENSLILRLKSIVFYCGFMFLSWVPMICQALDVISLIQGIMGQVTILIIAVIQNKENQYNQSIDINNNQRNEDQSRNLRIINSRPQINWQYFSSSTKKKINICIFFGIFVNLITHKMCLSMYNTQTLFYSNFFGYDINTYATRMLTLKESCPVGAPCQMYTTIPQNPSEAIFLNLHTHVDVESVDVFYQELLTSNVTDFKKVTASMIHYEGLERLARRNVHSALISGLKPNTKYLTKVFYKNNFWTNAIFKTLPAPGDKKTPIRMINAGDFGYNQIAMNMSKIVSKLKPDIFFIGGDLAYDDNMPACAYTWDQFFTMYGQVTNDLGYLMPMVAGVGNHDVGLNELSETNVTVSNQGPAFHIYFPQHLENSENGRIVRQSPSIKNRRTMFNFTFGNVHYVALDSGYMHGFDGYQKKFMIDSFEANKDKIKFVNYHVPIYSVCKGIDKHQTRLLQQIDHWVPQFDKYHVMASFENHVHSFKRTKPLVNGRPTQYGTVYMGDGGFSAFIQPIYGPDPGDDIFEAYANMNSFWLTQITQYKVQHWAYNNYGQIIDHFIQYPQNYTLNTLRESFESTNMKYQQLTDMQQNSQSRSQKLPYKESQFKLKSHRISEFQFNTNKGPFHQQFILKRRNDHLHNSV